MGLLSLELPGDRGTLIYTRPRHTPADYTILNFPVDDIEQTVDGLDGAGVEFPSVTRDSNRATEASLGGRGPR